MLFSINPLVPGTLFSLNMKSDPKETQPFGSKHVLGRLACGSASILLSFGYVRPLGVLWLGFEGF